MSEPSQRPPRVRVTGPPRRPASELNTSGAREIDAESALGEVFMRSLLREQLRLALLVLLTLGLSLGSLPLAFHLAPGLTSVRLAGVPLSWLLLTVLAYPWLFLLGWLYVRRAEANERAFAALVTATHGAQHPEQT